MIERSLYSHYWMANVISYATRLNERSQASVRQIMQNARILSIWEETGFDVAIHIRHGDKGGEMPLVDNVHYARTLDFLRDFLPPNPKVFLATDDDTSVTFFQKRPDLQLFVIQHNSSDSAFHMAQVILADIWASVRSTYTIGTFDSNVDRWIRELQDVAGGRASSIFFEVGNQPCFSAVHCKIMNATFAI
jgi:hypothetical protein